MTKIKENLKYLQIHLKYFRNTNYFYYYDGLGRAQYTFRK
jgi:hypothetical protein